MPAQELRAAYGTASLLYNTRLGAARVGDQGFRTQAGADHAQGFEDPPDRLREVDQVGLRHGLHQRQRFVDGAALHRVLDRGRGTDPHNAALEPRGFERETERGADQAGANDSDGFNHEGRQGPRWCG